MLPPKSQYQVQKTVVPTKNHGKDKVDSNADKVKNAKGRVVRFRSICEEFDVTPSRESSPVCEIEREDLPGRLTVSFINPLQKNLCKTATLKKIKNWFARPLNA